LSGYVNIPHAKSPDQENIVVLQEDYNLSLIFARGFQPMNFSMYLWVRTICTMFQRIFPPIYAYTQDSRGSVCGLP
jgi:hypothetical protein